MRANLAEQLTLLERELANLDALLESDARWVELCTVNSRRARNEDGARDQLAARARQLRSELTDNRIFVARERIVEALALMSDELEHEPALRAETAGPAEPSAQPKIAGHPVTANRILSPRMLSLVGDQMSLVPGRSGQPNPGEEIVDKDKVQILSRGRTKVKVQTKVAIHTNPPGGISSAPDHGAGKSDDLIAIRGINFETASRLNALGVRAYRQIADWSARDIASVRAALSLGTAITRENWIEQAALLDARSGPTADRADPVECGSSLNVVVDRTVGRGTREDAGIDEPVDVGGSSAVAGAAATILARLSVNWQVAKVAASIVAPVVSENLEDGSRDEPAHGEAARDNFVGVAAAGVLAGLGGHSLVDEPVQASDVHADRLTDIRDIDAVLAANLIEMGVTGFTDIAAWSASDIAHISVTLKLGQKITRQAWVEQAAVLASGEETSYSRHMASGLALRSGAQIDWDVSNPRGDLAAFTPEGATLTHCARANGDGGETGGENEDVVVDFEAARQSIETDSPRELPPALPDMSVPADTVAPALNGQTRCDETGLADDRSLEPADERADDPVLEAEVEIVAGEYAAIERDTDTYRDANGDFGEAAVSIVALEREVLHDAIEPRRDYLDPLVSERTDPWPVGEPEEPFDADDYAGYRRRVNEASVSIIAHEHRAGTIDGGDLGGADRLQVGLVARQTAGKKPAAG